MLSNNIIHSLEQLSCRHIGPMATSFPLGDMTGTVILADIFFDILSDILSGFLSENQNNRGKSLETVESIVEANTRLGVPIECQYIDIDYMERAMGFTIGEAFEGKIYIQSTIYMIK